MPTILVPSTCLPEGRALFVGNLRLHPFTETDTTTYPNPATMILQIDAIALPRYEGVVFRDTRLILEIPEPAGAYFVGYTDRPSSPWEIFDEGDHVWRSRPDNPPTKRLRIREDHVMLYRPALDGKTYFIGITGAEANDDIRITAFLDGYELPPPPHESCTVTISKLHVGDTIIGYIPNIFPDGL